MEKPMKLTGVVVAALTPLSADGASLADERIFAAYYDFLLQRPVAGLFVCGTTGEGLTLALAERLEVARRAVRLAKGRAPVLVHVGCASTAETVLLAGHASECGADAIVVVAPYFYPYDRQSLIEHFRAVAQAAQGRPVYLYHLPSYARNPIDVEILAAVRLACPNVCGIKFSDSDLAQMQEFQRAVGANFNLLTGDDSLVLPGQALGADGCVSGKSSVFPEMLQAILLAFREDRLEAARRSQALLIELGNRLDQWPGMELACFKYALLRRGVDIGGMRRPHRPLSATEREHLDQDFAELHARGVQF
jgi:dihydrodipicolinate synthase/N-acetylneuraminate lyase